VAWITPTNGAAVLHVERRVPTADGGMRIVAAMATADLGSSALLDDLGPTITLLPRPGSRDVLVWVLTPERTLSWLWAGDGTRRDVPVPSDWPATTYDLAWRPDGQAIAATASVSEAGEVREVIVVARLNGRTSTVVPFPANRPYDRLEGWWSNTELRLGHAICTEGCPGRHAWSARLGISNHRLTELTVADRAHGPVDTVVPVDPSGLDLTLGNDLPESTVHVTWPASIGATGPEFIGFAADGRSLIVASQPAQGTDIYRIADPAGRAIDGRLADPTPTLLGHLARRGVEVSVSPDERWALVTDRTGGIELAELATGRTWPIDRDTTTTWASPGS
jgi:hypothetical protein